MTYKFVTREEVEHEIKCMGEISLPLRALIDQVFAERDAYREVAQWKVAKMERMKGSRPFSAYDDDAFYNEVDAEAARLVQEKLLDGGRTEGK